MTDEGICDIHLIVPHPYETAILVYEEAGHVRLPGYSTSERDPTEVREVEEWLRDGLDLDAVVLRCVFTNSDAGSTNHARPVYSVENRSENGYKLPDGARWLTLEEIDTRPLVWEEQRTPLRDWFHERETGIIPPQRVSWALPGARAEIETWIRDRLAAHTAEPIRISVERSWSLSLVLRAQSPAGTWYFKAVPPYMRQEAAIVPLLDAWFPGQVPAPIATDTERGWMLMSAFEGTLLGALPREGHWDAALMQYGCLQRDTVKQKETILRAGLPDRGLAHLHDSLDEIVSGPSAREWLSDEVYERFTTALPTFRTICERLASFDIPSCCIHGDFHPNNVILTGNAYLYFDWTDAAVSHPFLDIPVFIDFWNRPKDDDVRRHLRDAYLAGWTGVSPGNNVRQALELAVPLAALFQVESYCRILANTEPSERWDCGSMPDICAGFALETAESARWETV